ncbi:hypothetical protein [Pseudomonas phage vB_PaeM_PAO1_Ab03]|uniref:Uncharacterized protein n=1 Tax=Pseudomonas phage vB_PaeM_PAO1_Ab03 TaxID=1548901 RepID=A0A0A1IUM3_9CAUD|nr:hypothetical protein VC54_gp115 [Pseudomonas phage vB_PaeM_PAO1_Ab03]CEF89201.1 hypothetical protein [Pseudomonas phage vB_PaeM_PAO1_Ab03]
MMGLPIYLSVSAYHLAGLIAVACLVYWGIIKMTRSEVERGNMTKKQASWWRKSYPAWAVICISVSCLGFGYKVEEIRPVGTFQSHPTTVDTGEKEEYRAYREEAEERFNKTLEALETKNNLK